MLLIDQIDKELQLKKDKVQKLKPAYNYYKIKGVNFNKKVFFFMENNLLMLNVRPKFTLLNVYIPVARNTSTMGADFTNVNLKENDVISLNLNGLFTQVI